MKKRARNIEPRLPPPIISQENVAELDSSIVMSLQKAHLFHPTLMPAKRLVLVFSQVGDEKEEGIVHFLTRERQIDVVAIDTADEQTFNQILQNTTPNLTVILVKRTELVPYNRYNELVNALPSNYGIICLTTTIPSAPFWDQFNVKILFLTLNVQQAEARLRYNVDTFAEHCQQHSEVARVEFKVDCQWLATFTTNHVASDLDAFCQRVNYKVLELASTGTEIVVDNEFCKSLMKDRGKGTYFLAHRDIDKDLNQYQMYMGKQPAVFNHHN